MPAIRLAAALAVLMLTPACMATKIVTVPVSVAGDVVEGTAKGAYYVGSTAVHVTGDALDGPDDKVRLKVKLKKRGGGTKTVTKTVDAKDIEREIDKIGRKGTIIDVQIEAVD